MKKLERGIMNVTGCFLAALMFLMMVDIFAAVLVRYVFHTALNFSEELGRYVFVWIVFIGMARCIAADKHVALDLLPGFLKGKSGRNLYAVIYIFSALFFSAVTYAGIKLCEVGEKQKCATMRIPMNYIYLCIRFLYKGIIINHNKKPSQPTLKRRFFKKKAAFFHGPVWERSGADFILKRKGEFF